MINLIYYANCTFLAFSFAGNSLVSPPVSPPSLIPPASPQGLKLWILSLIIIDIEWYLDCWILKSSSFICNKIPLYFLIVLMY